MPGGPGERRRARVLRAVPGRAGHAERRARDGGVRAERRLRRAPQGQAVCAASGVAGICLARLAEAASPGPSGSPSLVRWLCLCLGKLWENARDAQAEAFVSLSAPEAVAALLGHPAPDARAAAVYALGALVYVPEEGEPRADEAEAPDTPAAVAARPFRRRRSERRRAARPFRARNSERRRALGAERVRRARARRRRARGGVSDPPRGHGRVARRPRGNRRGDRAAGVRARALVPGGGGGVRTRAELRG